MEFIRTEKHYCGCIECQLTHFIYKANDGSLVKMCPICSKITIIGKWR